jgi:hypothetical protein
MRQHADAMWMCKSDATTTMWHVDDVLCPCAAGDASSNSLLSYWALSLWCYIGHFGLELHLSIMHASGKLVVLLEH